MGLLLRRDCSTDSSCGLGETGTSDEEPTASISDGAVDMVSGKWNQRVIAYLDLLTQVVVVVLNPQRWVTSKHCVR